MSTAMWIDFLLVIVFVACVWMAARRGIFNALSGLLGSVAGMGLAGVGCGTPVSTVFGTAIALGYYFFGSWHKGVIKAAPAPEETAAGE